MLRRATKLFTENNATMAVLTRGYQRVVPVENHEAYKDRWSSTNDPRYTQVTEIKDPEVWKSVERLLPKKLIPSPPTDDREYPSGWRPVRVKPGRYPYFVERTRNHLLPVYEEVDIRGPRFVTKVGNIQGDIWKLRAVLKQHLEELTGKPVLSKVHELNGSVGFKGKYVDVVQQWLYDKGF